MEHRTTIIELTIEPTKLFEIVQDWAQKSKFSIYEKRENRVIYSKSIRLVKAWLSVEHGGGIGKLEAWMSGTGVGPDFEGDAKKGWKIALPQGFGLGPQHIYRKKFNNLLNKIAEKYPHIIMDETVKIAPTVKVSTKSSLSPIFTIYGLFLVISGGITLLSALSFVSTKSFPDLANDMLLKSIFDIAVGILIFATSRAMAKGKALAIWLCGISMVIEVSGQLITGEKLNFLFIMFGIYALWHISQENKRQASPALASSD